MSTRGRFYPFIVVIAWFLSLCAFAVPGYAEIIDHIHYLKCPSENYEWNNAVGYDALLNTETCTTEIIWDQYHGSAIPCREEYAYGRYDIALETWLAKCCWEHDFFGYYDIYYTGGEICDGIDNNCNGQIDEDCPKPKPCEGPDCGQNDGPGPGGPSPSPGDPGPSCVGDPVEPYSGRYFYHEYDMGYPAPSLVSIVRTYSSDNPTFGLFGKGTNTMYNLKLVEDGNNLKYIAPDHDCYTLYCSGGSCTNTGYPFLSHATGYLSPVRKLVFEGGSTYTFDDDGWLIRETDRNGNWVDISRDTGGIINGISDSFGRSLAITSMDLAGTVLVEKIEDSLGRGVVYDYDTEYAILNSVTFPDGSRVAYTYENGMVNSVTHYEDYADPYAPVVSEVLNTYSTPSGRVTSQTFSDNGVLSLDYVESGGLVVNTTVTDPRDNATRYEYNSYGYPTAIVDPYSNSTSYGRNQSTNQLTSVTDELDRTMTYTYESGLVNSVTDPAGNVTSYEYEDPNVNRATKVTDAKGNTTTYAYDSKGNITSILPPGASTATTMTYNQWGLINTITSALSNTVSFGYDSFGMLNSISDDLGNTSSFEYDAIGRIINSTDPKGRTTSYAYLDRGREVEITDPMQGVTTVTYNSKGKLLSVEDAKGQMISYTYDSKGNVDSMTDQTRSASESYDHDLNDNPTSVTDRKSQTTSVPSGGYDDMDRLMRVDFDDDSYTTFAYDAVGRIVNAVDSVSGQLDFAYTNTVDCGTECDAYPDRVKSVETPQGDIDYTYDELGRRTSMTVEGQDAVEYDYLPNGLMNTISMDHTTLGLLEFGFSYDAAGRRTGISYPNGVTGTYTYDAAGRVETIVYRDSSSTVLESLSYTYDANGNRTSVSRLGVEPILPGITNSTYNNSLNRMDSFNGETLTYDANGNLTHKGDMVLTWDARDRLVSITNSPGGDASFSYDPFGRRESKTVNGVKTNYLYDGQDIVEERDGSGSLKAFYIRTLNIDEPLARIEPGGTIRYYLADALGSIIALVDDNEVVKTRYNYSPFGVTEIAGEASDNPFMFTGRELDNTGLYYYRARYYSPDMGRFISEDPIGFAGGDVNFYRYVGNSPLNWIDPLGYTAWPTNYCNVTSGYSLSRTINGRTRPHTAIDVRNPAGQPTYSTDAGVIIEIGINSESGNYIKIRLSNGDEISYSHTSTNLMEGDCVKEGQHIGTSDSSGTNEPHLHFVYRSCSNGQCRRTDPLDYLTGATMVGTGQICSP